MPHLLWIAASCIMSDGEVIQCRYFAAQIRSQVATPVVLTPLSKVLLTLNGKFLISRAGVVYHYHSYFLEWPIEKAGIK